MADKVPEPQGAPLTATPPPVADGAGQGPSAATPPPLAARRKAGERVVVKLSSVARTAPGAGAPFVRPPALPATGLPKLTNTGTLPPVVKPDAAGNETAASPTTPPPRPAKVVESGRPASKAAITRTVPLRETLRPGKPSLNPTGSEDSIFPPDDKLDAPEAETPKGWKHLEPGELKQVAGDFQTLEVFTRSKTGAPPAPSTTPVPPLPGKKSEPLPGPSLSPATAKPSVAPTTPAAPIPKSVPDSFIVAPPVGNSISLPSTAPAPTVLKTVPAPVPPASTPPFVPLSTSSPTLPAEKKQPDLAPAAPLSKIGAVSAFKPIKRVGKTAPPPFALEGQTVATLAPPVMSSAAVAAPSSVGRLKIPEQAPIIPAASTSPASPTVPFKPELAFKTAPVPAAASAPKSDPVSPVSPIDPKKQNSPAFLFYKPTAGATNPPAASSGRPTPAVRSAKAFVQAMAKRFRLASSRKGLDAGKTAPPLKGAEPVLAPVLGSPAKASEPAVKLTPPVQTPQKSTAPETTHKAPPGVSSGPAHAFKQTPPIQPPEKISETSGPAKTPPPLPASKLSAEPARHAPPPAKVEAFQAAPVAGKAPPPISTTTPHAEQSASPSVLAVPSKKKSLLARAMNRAPKPKAPARPPLTRAERAQRKRRIESIGFWVGFAILLFVLHFLGDRFSRETRMEGQVIPRPGTVLDKEAFIVGDFRDLASSVADDLARERTSKLQEIQEPQEHVRRAQADVSSRDERVRLLQDQLQAAKTQIAAIVQEARDAAQKVWDGPGAQLDEDYKARLDQLQKVIADHAKSLNLKYQPDDSYHSPEVWANAYRLALYDVPAGVDSAKEHQWLDDQMKQWRAFTKELDDRQKALRQQAAEIQLSPSAKVTELNNKIDDLQHRIDATLTEEEPIKAELQQAQADLEQKQTVETGLDDIYYKQLYSLPEQNINKRLPLAPNGRFSWRNIEKENNFAGGQKFHRYWIFVRATRADGRQYWALFPFDSMKDRTTLLSIEPAGFISTKAILRPNLTPDEAEQ
jgi:hypothetical protein